MGRIILEITERNAISVEVEDVSRWNGRLLRQACNIAMRKARKFQAQQASRVRNEAKAAEKAERERLEKEEQTRRDVHRANLDRAGKVLNKHAEKAAIAAVAELVEADDVEAAKVLAESRGVPMPDKGEAAKPAKPAKPAKEAKNPVDSGLAEAIAKHESK